jgi:hypothetical protein
MTHNLMHMNMNRKAVATTTLYAVLQCFDVVANVFCAYAVQYITAIKRACKQQRKKAPDKEYICIMYDFCLLFW